MGSQTIALPLELRSILAGLSSAEVAEDQKWILTLLREHGLQVITVLWRMLGSEPDVLDAYQTAVCQLTARGRDAVQANAGGYFYRIALNAGISTIRARKRQQRQWPSVIHAQVRRQEQREVAAFRTPIDQRQILDQLRSAIFRLPPHLRDVIILRDIAEMPYSNVAQILGIGAGTARLYRRQAVIRLAGLIGQEAME